ncbi:MAG: 23S rRNA (uracil(1939)-C(5))-methyltransferase RlmD [Aquabacterium sp.]
MAENNEWLQVESLDLEAHGVAHDATGKVVFIEGALPGERVQVVVSKRKAAWERGTMTTMARESPLRVRPRCPHFVLHRGACGGCKMQHLDAAAQVAIKQRVLEDNLAHLAKVRTEQVLRPIEGPAWGYRHRARLSVRHVAAKGVVLVGFHERQSRYVADMDSCAVLPPKVSAMLPALRRLIGEMEARDRLPQIELAQGDTVVALVLRHLEPLTTADRQRLQAFGIEHDVQWWLQPKGPDTVALLDPADERRLGYALPEFGVTMPYRPTDFTQVNAAINRVLVDRAVRLLAPQTHERVIDWFCGLGNFSLPLATRCAEVLGIEGAPALVERARQNAALNGLEARTRFVASDLFALDGAALAALGKADRWLVDPPREGAFALAKALADLAQTGAPQGWRPPRRIVYVSCNPATLARDAGLLVHQAGYRCSAAGVVNMFPHTAHTESMAVFDLETGA